MEILIHLTFRQQLPYPVFIEAVRENAVLVHQISHKYDSSRLGHTLGFKQSLQFLLIAYQMIKRSEQKCDVGNAVGKERHIPRIALHHVGPWLALEKHLDIAAHKLHCLHLVAFSHQCRRVSSSACAYVKQKLPRLQESTQMVHRDLKLHDAVPAQQTQVFRMFVVMLLYIG